MPVSDGFAARCFWGTACRFPLTCGIEDSPAAPRGIPPKIQRFIFGSPVYERMCPSACGLQPAFADNFPETEQELHAQRTAFARMLPAAFCCGGHFPMCGLPAGGTPSDRRKFSVNRRLCGIPLFAVDLPAAGFCKAAAYASEHAESAFCRGRDGAFPASLPSKRCCISRTADRSCRGIPAFGFCKTIADALAPAVNGVCGRCAGF